MFNFEDSVQIDLRASFTKEEAVAKMIGWMRGYIHPEIIELTDLRAESEFLTYRHITHFNLQERLNEIREKARVELAEAMRDSDDFDAFEECDALERIDEQIKKVAFYLVEITDEAAKGNNSLLRVDPYATTKTGIPHYTLKSIDQWSRKYFEISILDYPWTLPESLSSATSIEPKDIDTKPSTTSVLELTDTHEQKEADNENDEENNIVDSEIYQTEQLSQTEISHLQATLALVVEAYATTMEEIYELDKTDQTTNKIRQKFIKDEKTKEEKANNNTEDDYKLVLLDLNKEWLNENGRPKKKKFTYEGKPNFSFIAKQIEQIAKKYSYNPRLPDRKQKPILAQSEENIRKLLSNSNWILRKQINDNYE